MHSDEVARVASQLVASLGLCWDAADFSALSAAIGTFRYFKNYTYTYLQFKFYKLDILTILK